MAGSQASVTRSDYLSKRDTKSLIMAGAPNPTLFLGKEAVAGRSFRRPKVTSAHRPFWFVLAVTAAAINFPFPEGY